MSHSNDKSKQQDGSHTLGNALLLASLIYPVLIAGGSSVMFKVLIPCEVPDFPLALERNYQGALVASLYTWGISVIVVMTASTWLVAMSGRMLWGVECRSWRRGLFLGIVALAIAVPTILISEDFVGFQNCISAEIVLETVKGKKAGEPWPWLGPRTELNVLMPEILVFVQVIGIVAILFLAGAAVAPLLRNEPGEADTPETLAKQARDLRTLLFSGAIALVAVYLSFDALFSIPEALLPQTDPKDAKVVHPDLALLREFVGGLKIFWGAILTLVLVTIFLVPFLVVSRRSLELAQKTNPGATPPELTKWLTDNGLVESWQTRITKVTAVLAPFLSGPLASAIGELPIF